tara:strand:- start:719 stop:1981 length:1263 start_codon:yes stop_codon:yes gene_type:complete
MPRKKKKQEIVAAGIRELVWVDPKSLDDNPLNWRKHPTRQKNAISASIKANGWSDTLTYNETTGKLIDGHARKSIAIKEGIESVPVLIGSWTEEQEKHLLATLDPLAAMAETDAEALQSLTESLQEETEQIQSLGKKDQETLTQLTQELDNYAFEVSVGTQKKTMLPKRRLIKEQEEDLDIEVRSDEAAVLEMNEEAIFASSNVWGFPDLLEDLLYDEVPTQTWDRDPEFDVKNPNAWYCHSARPFPEKREGGILGFYTEDYRFESAWNNTGDFTQRLIDEAWSAVAAPQYSTWWDWPLVVRMHNVYRCRWLLRFWQDWEIPVIPNLTWDHTDESFAWAFDTLPKNIPVVGVECRTLNQHGSFWKRFQAGLEEGISRISPGSVILYGGGTQDNRKYLRDLPGGTNYVYLDSYMGSRRKHL